MAHKKSKSIQALLKPPQASVKTQTQSLKSVGLAQSVAVQTSRSLKPTRTKIADASKEEFKHCIITLYKAGHDNGSILEQVSALEYPHAQRVIWETVKRFKERGTIVRREGSGRPRKVRKVKVIETVKEKVTQDPTKSMNQLAIEEGISYRSMRRICHEELGLKSYKKVRGQHLRPSAQEKRHSRSQFLLDFINGLADLNDLDEADQRLA